MLAAGSHLAGAAACSIPRSQQPKLLRNGPATATNNVIQASSNHFRRCSQRRHGEDFDDMDAAYNSSDGRGVSRPAYLAPCIIFPELGERLAAQVADHAARSELAERQAALDQVKAQAKVTQRALDEAQRNIAALQGILDKSFAILEASRRDRLRGQGGRKHSGEPGGLSIPRRRRPAAEAAKRMRWVAKMQARADLAMDDFSG